MMYKFAFLLLVLGLTSAGQSHGQVTKEAIVFASTPAIEFQEQMIPFANAVQPACKVTLVGDEDAYAKHFKTWLENNFGIEGKRNNGFVAMPFYLYTNWSRDSIHVYYRTEKDADKFALFFLASNGKVFLNQTEHTSEWSAIRISLKSQIKEYYVNQYERAIADQQKEYERQAKDVEKSEAKIAKLNEKIKTENENIAEENAKIQALALDRNKVDQELKVLNATLQQDKKLQDQAQKEVDQQNVIIKDKESLYNTMNSQGTLASKDGKKVTKELAKLRKSQVKLQDRLTEVTSQKTKTENAVLKKEEEQIKLEGSNNELAARKAKHESALSEAKADLDSWTSTTQDERREMDTSLRALDALKSAKNGLSGL